jgi:hypothetical protein
MQRINDVERNGMCGRARRIRERVRKWLGNDVEILILAMRRGDVTMG